MRYFRNLVTVASDAGYDSPEAFWDEEFASGEDERTGKEALVARFGLQGNARFTDLYLATTEDEDTQIYDRIVGMIPASTRDEALCESLGATVEVSQFGGELVVFTNEWGMGTIWTTRRGAEIIAMHLGHDSDFVTTIRTETCTSRVDGKTFTVTGTDQAMTYLRGEILEKVEKLCRIGSPAKQVIADIGDMEGSGGGYYWLFHVDGLTRSVRIEAFPSEDAYKMVEIVNVSVQKFSVFCNARGITHLTWQDADDNPCIRSVRDIKANGP